MNLSLRLSHTSTHYVADQRLIFDILAVDRVFLLWLFLDLRIIRDRCDEFLPPSIPVPFVDSWALQLQLCCYLSDFLSVPIIIYLEFSLKKLLLVLCILLAWYLILLRLNCLFSYAFSFNLFVEHSELNIVLSELLLEHVLLLALLYQLGVLSYYLSEGNHLKLTLYFFADLIAIELLGHG